jgi:hypothetical protein
MYVEGAQKSTSGQFRLQLQSVYFIVVRVGGSLPRSLILTYAMHWPDPDSQFHGHVRSAYILPGVTWKLHKHRYLASCIANRIGCRPEWSFNLFRDTQARAFSVSE